MNQFETSVDVVELFKALTAFQTTCEGPKKGSWNGHFKSKYADLADVIQAVKPVMVANGLSLVQSPYDGDNGRVGVVTQLNHVSGQWARGMYSMPVTKNDPQAVGTGISYARRYALLAILGLAAEDDDGNAASEKPTQSPVVPREVASEQRSLQPTSGHHSASTTASVSKSTPLTTTDHTETQRTEPQKCTQEQVDKINSLFTQLGVTSQPGRSELAMRFAGVPTAPQLNQATAQKLIVGLGQELINRKQGK